ncbi:MAG: hypothetical protein ACE3JP_15385 [Ectobacillus sp.]
MTAKIIEGQLDFETKMLTIDYIKHVPTHTVLSQRQIHALCERLNYHEESESLAITLNNEYPLLLTAAEVQQLKNELLRYTET